MEPIKVKGKEEMVPIFRPLPGKADSRKTGAGGAIRDRASSTETFGSGGGAAADRAATSAGGERRRQKKTLGREDEVGLLRQGLSMLGGGKGGAMMLIGEAGMGKTHLVDVLRVLHEKQERRLSGGDSVDGASGAFSSSSSAAAAAGTGDGAAAEDESYGGDLFGLFVNSSRAIEATTPFFCWKGIFEKLFTTRMLTKVCALPTSPRVSRLRPSSLTFLVTTRMFTQIVNRTRKIKAPEATTQVSDPNLLASAAASMPGKRAVERRGSNPAGAEAHTTPNKQVSRREPIKQAGAPWQRGAAHGASRQSHDSVRHEAHHDKLGAAVAPAPPPMPAEREMAPAPSAFLGAFPPDDSSKASFSKGSVDGSSVDGDAHSLASNSGSLKALPNLAPFGGSVLGRVSRRSSNDAAQANISPIKGVFKRRSVGTVDPVEASPEPAPEVAAAGSSSSGGGGGSSVSSSGGGGGGGVSSGEGNPSWLQSMWGGREAPSRRQTVRQRWRDAYSSVLAFQLPPYLLDGRHSIRPGADEALLADENFITLAPVAAKGH